MLVKYLLAMTKGTGTLNMGESRTYSQLEVSHGLKYNLQQCCQPKVLLPRKICSPGGVCLQVSSGLWETQALVM